MSDARVVLDASAHVEGLLANAHRVLDRYTGKAAHRCLPGLEGSGGLRTRLLASGTGLIDRLTLKVMEPIFLSGDHPDLKAKLRQRVNEGREHYGSLELITEPERFFRAPRPPETFKVSSSRGLKQGVRLRVAFETTYETFDPDYQAEFTEENSPNHLNSVHFWRHNDVQRPTVICVHPWCLSYLPFDEVVFAARSLYAQGLNVALFTMPFHGPRTPKRARFGGQLFPSNDVQRTNEAFGQAVADLRVLMDWLRCDQGSGPIGMMGFSLGGYTTALMASLEPDLLFAIPVVAPSTFADIMWDHGEGNRLRKFAEGAGVTRQVLRALLAVHSPLVRPLRIPRERTLIVWGRGDRIVSSAHIQALWEHWKEPRIHAFTGGHMMHLGRLGRRGYVREIKAFIGEQVQG